MTERSYEINTGLLRKTVDVFGGVSAVARKTGYQKQRFSHWLTGTNRMPESAVKKICTELDISPKELIQGDFKNFVEFVYPRLTNIYS
jgi:Cro/C1-type HTH DNA-binding domain